MPPSNEEFIKPVGEVERLLKKDNKDKNTKEEAQQSTFADLLNNRYKVISLIAEGGESFVFKALDTHTNDYVVLKKKKSSPNAQWFESIERYSKIQIDEIAGHIDLFSIKDAHMTHTYQVMEFIEGETLEEEIQRLGGSYTLDDVKDIVIDILETLEKLQSFSIPVLHRDIKPSNIIRDKLTNRMTLLDFGISTSFVDKTFGHTHAIGTEGYVSPEQYEGDPCLSSDVYSVGVMAFEMITGIKPLSLAQGLGVIDWKPSSSGISKEWINWFENVLVEKDKRVSNATEAKTLLLNGKSNRSIKAELSFPQWLKWILNVCSFGLISPPEPIRSAYLGEPLDSIKKETRQLKREKKALESQLRDLERRCSRSSYELKSLRDRVTTCDKIISEYEQTYGPELSKIDEAYKLQAESYKIESAKEFELFKERKSVEYAEHCKTGDAEFERFCRSQDEMLELKKSKIIEDNNFEVSKLRKALHQREEELQEKTNEVDKKIVLLEKKKTQEVMKFRSVLESEREEIVKSHKQTIASYEKEIAHLEKRKNEILNRINTMIDKESSLIESKSNEKLAILKDAYFNELDVQDNSLFLRKAAKLFFICLRQQKDIFGDIFEKTIKKDTKFGGGDKAKCYFQCKTSPFRSLSGLSYDGYFIRHIYLSVDREETTINFSFNIQGQVRDDERIIDGKEMNIETTDVEDLQDEFARMILLLKETYGPGY